MKLLLDGKDYYHDFSFWNYLEFAFLFLILLVIDILAFPSMEIEIIVLSLAIEGIALFFMGAFTIGSGPAQVRQMGFYDEGIKFHAQGFSSKEKYLPYKGITSIRFVFYANPRCFKSECEIRTGNSYERVRTGFWTPFGFKRFVKKVRRVLEGQGFEEVDSEAGGNRSLNFVFKKKEK